MNKQLLKSALALALIAALGAQAQAQTGSATKGAAKPVVASTADKEAPYVVVQDSWIYVIDEPGVYLDRARGEVARKQYKLAATNLRKAAAMIDKEAADRASDDDKTKLTRDAAALLVTAQDVGAGKVTDARQLDKQMAQARANLASHHYIKSAEAWAKKDYVAAGASLAAAAHYVENGFGSLGQKATGDVKSAASYGDRLTDQGASAVESDFNAARNAVGGAIDKLGKAIESRKTA